MTGIQIPIRKRWRHPPVTRMSAHGVLHLAFGPLRKLETPPNLHQNLIVEITDAGLVCALLMADWLMFHLLGSAAKSRAEPEASGQARTRRLRSSRFEIACENFLRPGPRVRRQTPHTQDDGTGLKYFKTVQYEAFDHWFSEVHCRCVGALTAWPEKGLGVPSGGNSIESFAKALLLILRAGLSRQCAGPGDPVFGTTNPEQHPIIRAFWTPLGLSASTPIANGAVDDRSAHGPAIANHTNFL